MKVIKLTVFFFLLSNFNLTSQRSCSFDSLNNNDKITCANLQEQNEVSTQIERILNYIGLKKNFVIAECENLKNAIAFIDDDDVPEDIKTEVFNSLNTLTLIGDLADLFTIKFAKTNTFCNLKYFKKKFC